jgi:molybdopterin molybdotransferase
MSVDRQIFTFYDACQCVCDLIPSRAVQQMASKDASGRIVSGPVYAHIDQPPFARAMMDGFAIRAADSVDSTPLAVIDEAAAGRPATKFVTSGTAIRISTGAPVPVGADAVARIEWCDVETEAFQIHILRPVSPGESIQPRGSDAERGDVILSAGDRLDGINQALCHACGVTSVDIYAPLRVSLLSTGSELEADAYIPLQHGHVYAVNDIFIASVLQNEACHIVRNLLLRDDAAVIHSALTQAVTDSDIVIFTGGASVGIHDYVPDVIRMMADKVMVEKVWMRPGSPFVAARCGSTAVFGLSGNPAAAFVQFESLIRPAIRQTFSQPDTPFPLHAVVTHELHEKPVKGVRIMRACVWEEDGRLYADARRSQSPGVLSSFQATNALMLLTESTNAKGTMVPIRLFRELMPKRSTHLGD